MYKWHTERKRNKSKYNTQENHQITIKDSRRRRKENRKKYTHTINKMATSTPPSITTSNVNGINAPSKRCSLSLFF